MFTRYLSIISICMNNCPSSHLNRPIGYWPFKTLCEFCDMPTNTFDTDERNANIDKELPNLTIVTLHTIVTRHQLRLGFVERGDIQFHNWQRSCPSRSLHHRLFLWLHCRCRRFYVVVHTCVHFIRLVLHTIKYTDVHPNPFSIQSV